MDFSERTLLVTFGALVLGIDFAVVVLDDGVWGVVVVDCAITEPESTARDKTVAVISFNFIVILRLGQLELS